MIGRKNEQERLLSALENEESEFIAVYGRRRVGKTYLIRQTFGNGFAFYHTGLAKSPMSDQLAAFGASLNEYGGEVAEPPKNWLEAFTRLRRLLEKSSGGKKVVFIDELPWMDTPRSRFLPAVENFWNSWASARTDIVFVICGSATSWIIRKVIRNHGGLHNRLTGKIRVKPFTLAECEEYAESRRLGMSRQQIAEAYMAFGGIPHYWSFLRKELSLAQNIDNIFFAEDGELAGEFDELYASLFRRKQIHIGLVTLLAKHRAGLNREQIVKLGGTANNGRLTERLEELEQCGFIRSYHVVGSCKSDLVYQLTDFFSFFYFAFIAKNLKRDEEYWTNHYGDGAFMEWRGRAFEMLAVQHIREIKAALGIAGVGAECGCWRHVADETHPQGVQIDLVIDRDDKVINLCEMKCTEEPYAIDAEEDRLLRRHREVFRKVTGTVKSLHQTMVVAAGLVKNMYANSVQKVITLDDLYAR